jgi:hypothetical protein
MRPARSNPVNMPKVPASAGVVPVLIESGSGSKFLFTTVPVVCMLPVNKSVQHSTISLELENLMPQQTAFVMQSIHI